MYSYGATFAAGIFLAASGFLLWQHEGGIFFMTASIAACCVGAAFDAHKHGE
jgi:uncharacterized membrane protein YesL